MNGSPFRAVLFDLDNTLYDREAAFARWTDAYLRDTLHLTDAEEARRVHDLIREMDANGYGSKATIFERLHALYPTLPGVPARSVDVFFDEFLRHITPEAETEALLDALQRAGLLFGVITNGSARQWRKLENLGPTRRTSCLFVSETFGGKKPDRAIFEAAAVHLGVPPAQTLFIGDNPTVDILGAQASGMKAAWLHRGQLWPERLVEEPDFVTGTLGDLAGILGAAWQHCLLGAQSCGIILVGSSLPGRADQQHNGVWSPPPTRRPTINAPPVTVCISSGCSDGPAGEVRNETSSERIYEQTLRARKPIERENEL